MDESPLHFEFEDEAIPMGNLKPSSKDEFSWPTLPPLPEPRMFFMQFTDKARRFDANGRMLPDESDES